MRWGGRRAAAVGHAVVGLLAVAAPVLACSALSTITVENRQARDLRVDASGIGYLGVAKACSVSQGSTYIPSLPDTDSRVRVHFRDEAGQPAAEAEVPAEPLGGLGGGYRLRVAVPERQAGECPSMTEAPLLTPTPTRPAP